MTFGVLAATGDEGRRWAELLLRLPLALRDLHFQPEYGLIYRDTYGHEPLLAYYEEAAGFVIQPFVRRRLDGLAFLAEQGVTEAFYDIANAYGYGGPLCAAPPLEANALLQRFDTGFCDWCHEHRIAAEFCSLHPLLGNHTQVMAALPHLVLRKEKSVVYLDLTPSDENLWRAVNRGHRSSIEKARRAGICVVRVVADAENLATFRRLYLQTMARHAAAERWYFPDNYFENCVASLGSQRASLFFARVAGKVASAYLLLHDFATAYYHFGGSDSTLFALRPNNLLLYETARWAKEAGYLCYHLGGGVTPRADDSLLRFKAGFGGRRATLFTYGRVHHEATYRRLCELKCAHELKRLGTPQESDYFPLYRR